MKNYINEAINIIIEEDYYEKARTISKGLKKTIRIEQEYPNIVEDIRGIGALRGLRLSTKNLAVSKITKYLPLVNLNNLRFIENVATPE